MRRIVLVYGSMKQQVGMSHETRVKETVRQNA